MSTVKPETATRELGAGTSRPAATEEPTIGRLVHDALEDASSLVRNEIALAKAEVSMDVKKAGKGGAMLAAAGVVALLGVIFLLHTIAIGIAEFLPLWAGYLIVTVVLLVVAGVLALVGKKALQSVRGKPERTIATSKETIEAVKSAAAN